MEKRKATSLEDLLQSWKDELVGSALQTCSANSVITDGLVKAWSVINNPQYSSILCSVSGGSDSDIMLDIIWRCDRDKKVTYVWYNTGLEYQATKDHLHELEKQYGISIMIQRPEKPVTTACKQCGQPFLSKKVSDFMWRLQKHAFQWEDEPYETLIKKYPNCQSALGWWCDCKQSKRLGISYNRFLKEFIMANPPSFRISNRCCDYVKKDPAHKVIRSGGYRMNILGIRRGEGGMRSFLNGCFQHSAEVDVYRPLFWYTNAEKEQYEEVFQIQHSACYTEYGLTRTGCAGCPYGKNFEQELAVLEKHEPKLYAAATSIFKDSYEYTRKYRAFQKQMNGRV